MRDKAILENGGTLKGIPDCTKMKKGVKQLIITLMR